MKGNVLIVILCALVLPACLLQDGNSCKSKNLKESRRSGLFIQSYKVEKYSQGRMKWDIKEVWIEKQCVYNVGFKEKVDGFMLIMRFASEITWYPNGVQNGAGIIWAKGYERWFDKSGSHNLEMFLEYLPESDTLHCYFFPSETDTIQALDSFLLVLDNEDN